MRLLPIIVVAGAIQAQTRIQADQIKDFAPDGKTAISIEQVAKFGQNQLAGNIQIIRGTMTVVETGEEKEAPAIVVVFPRKVFMKNLGSPAGKGQMPTGAR